MLATDATNVINNLIVYKPEWRFEASLLTKRFEEAIRVDVTYEARNSNRDKAPDYSEWIPGGARASFTLMVGMIPTYDELLRVLITDVIMVVELHEAREFLRYRSNLVAPYHPHRSATMAAWGDRDSDLAFGLS